MKKKIGILEPEHFSEVALKALHKQFDIELYYGENTLKEFVEDKNILFVRLKYEINDELLAKAKFLEYICSPTTGLNHIVTSKKVKIISLKGEENFLQGIRATPEHTFGLALALLRNYRYAFRSIQCSSWQRDLYKGDEIYLNNVGIIGFGRVGRLLASYYKAFEAKVYFYDIRDIRGVPKEFEKKPSVTELIKSSNIIHLCASYSDEYKAFFDKKYFNMLPGKYFINTARGELINENDLKTFLKIGKFKGVALDVLDGETTDKNALKEIINIAEGKNVIITPHIAGATFMSMKRTEEFVAEKLLLSERKERNCCVNK